MGRVLLKHSISVWLLIRLWLLSSILSRFLSSGCLPVLVEETVENTVPGSGDSLQSNMWEELENTCFAHEDNFYSVPLLSPSRGCILVSQMGHFTARQPQKLSPNNGVAHPPWLDWRVFSRPWVVALRVPGPQKCSLIFAVVDWLLLSCTRSSRSSLILQTTFSYDC